MITQIYVFQKLLASMHATVSRRKSAHWKHKIIEKFGYFNVKNGVCCVSLGNKVKRSRQNFMGGPNFILKPYLTFLPL